MTAQGFHTPLEEDLPPLTPPRPSSYLQPPTPTSAIMTSLEGYLEPHRLSFSSPPNSEMIAHHRNPSEAHEESSYPVFSPPPYPSSMSHHRRSSSLGVPWLPYLPRKSLSNSSHHTCNLLLVFLLLCHCSFGMIIHHYSNYVHVLFVTLHHPV